MNILLISKRDYLNLNNYKVIKCIDYDEIIKKLKEKYDAIIIDGRVGINTLQLLENYPNPSDLNKTIIIDNNYYCYNLINNPYQLFAIIGGNNIKYIDYYLSEIEKRNILKKLGISPDKDGFHYLRRAIYECYINPTAQKNYTELYMILENTFSTTRKDVERSIRYSISVGFGKSDYEYSEKLFSNILDLERAYPKNSEFIAVVLEELFRMHHKTIY